MRGICTDTRYPKDKGAAERHTIELSRYSIVSPAHSKTIKSLIVMLLFAFIYAFVAVPNPSPMSRVDLLPHLQT